MNHDRARDLERRIAALLHVGTWTASAVITVGMVMPRGAWVVSGGIALFIALPILRVVVASVELLRRRDFRVGAISVLVLAIIALGIAVGLHGRATAL
ncbi:MAG TPA: DUF1634 domain-containing protein [Polyangiaceae bacterium]